jgi:predicted amidohydrolase
MGSTLSRDGGYTGAMRPIRTALSLALALIAAPAPARTFLAAAVEFNPVLHDRDHNLDAMAGDIETALKHGAKLVVAPEMALTGYLYTDRADIAPYVDTIPGVATARIARLARQYHAWIVFGMPEKDATTGIYYNAAALVGPEGVVGKYRKLHQWEAEEHWAAWGDMGIPVYDTELGRIAINICMDSGFFESSRLAALAGADVIAFPTNSSIQAVWYNQARALQNGVYVIGANRNTTEKQFHMVGISGIWGPDGDLLAETPLVAKDQPPPHATQIAYAAIDTDRYATRARRLAGRRPELYQPLVLNVAPWDYSVDAVEHPVKALALQYVPTTGDKQATLATIETALGQAAPADLIVLPEYSLTGEGRGITPARAAEWAEPIDGASFAAFSRIAVQRHANLVYSQIERADGHLYVTSVIVGRDGKRIGTYRKTHLSAAERAWAGGGDALPVFTLPGLGTIGLLSGEDVLYPETAGVLMEQRADMIAIPSSWTGPADYGAWIAANPHAPARPYPDHAMALWDAVAFSAQAYTVVANFTGSEAHYAGASALYTLDPLYGLDQAVIAPVDKAVGLPLSFTTKRNDWWVNQAHIVANRRTDYYKPLLTTPLAIPTHIP